MEVLRNEGEPSFGEWLEAVVIGAGDRPGAAERVRSACIELAHAAEGLGEARQVAAEATRFFLKRKDGRELDDLLAAARRGSGDSSSPPDAEADAVLLRRLQDRVRGQEAAGK